jgi:hypothetical protein
LDPFSLFINAIRAERTRRKYQARLNTFFNYIFLPDTNIEERCNLFIKNCIGNPKYAMNNVFKFITHIKERGKDTLTSYSGEKFYMSWEDSLNVFHHIYSKEYGKKMKLNRGPRISKQAIEDTLTIKFYNEDEAIGEF